MKKNIFPVRKLKTILMLSLYLLSLDVVSALADGLPDHIRQAVTDSFPGSAIVESRHENWKGQMVFEVEIEAQGGRRYEVIVSENGSILDTQEEKGLPFIGGELAIGLGVQVEQSIYKGVDTEIEPAPFFKYENNRLEITAYDGIDIAYAFYRTDSLAVSGKGSISFNEGYDRDDSTYLNGMDELDTLYSVGLSSEWAVKRWRIGLEVLQDVSGEHDGQEAELSLGYTWMAAGFELTPRLSLTWMSSDMADYFYGVSSREARPDRQVYSPGSSVEMELELMVQRQIYGNFTAVGIVGVTMFGSEITDSPLVDEDYAAEFVLGIMYTF